MNKNNISSDKNKPIRARRLEPRLYRIFNDLHFKTGGRFYGAQYQNISEKDRKRLLINGEQVFEYDFKNLHIKMLYDYININFEGSKKQNEMNDAYVLEKYYKYDNYDATFNARLRKFIKIAVNILINTNGIVQTKEAIYEEFLEDEEFFKVYVKYIFGSNNKPKDYKIKTHIMELIDIIKTKHEPIQKYFHSGIGIKLQRIDSDIAEAVLKYFTNKNIPCLCIHDSFIVPTRYSDLLIKTMEKYYKKVIKKYIAMHFLD